VFAPRIRDVVIAVLGGFIIFLLLRPNSGQDSMPPKCWNAFDGEVDCDRSAWPWALVVAVALLVVMWLLSILHARRESSS